MIPMDAADGPSVEDMLGADAMVVRALHAQRCAVGRPRLERQPARLPRRRAPGGQRRRQRRSLARLYAGLIGGVDGGPSEGLSPANRSTPCARSRRRDAIRCSRCRASISSRRSRSASGRCHRSRRWVASLVRALRRRRFVGFADPEHHLAGGYVMSKMGLGISVDPRERPHPWPAYQPPGPRSPTPDHANRRRSGRASSSRERDSSWFGGVGWGDRGWRGRWFGWRWWR